MSTEPRDPKFIDKTCELFFNLLDMINLPYPFFTWFPVQYVRYSPFYVNLGKTRNIFSNSKFLERLEGAPNGHPASKFNDVRTLFAIDFEGENVSSDLIDKALTRLHICPKLADSLFFSPDQRAGSRDESEMWLPTERFFWTYPPYNLGSSRHILLPSLQLKGSGRNPLAVRPDPVHSWGGQYLWECMKAIAFGHIYKGILPRGLLETMAVSLHHDELISSNVDDYALNSTLMREARSYRLTQIMTDFDPHASDPKTYYQKLAMDELKKKKVTFPESYYFQYGSMLILGLNDLNITKENVMLDGSLIDYEDISYRGDQNHQCFEIKFLSKKDKKVNTEEEKLNRAVLYTSNFHMYLSAIEMTQKAYHRFLEQDFDEDKIRSGFLDFIKDMDQKVCSLSESQVEMLEILATLKSLYIDGIPYYHLQGERSDRLIQIILNHSLKEISFVDLDEHNELISVVLKFPKARWKKEELNTYYNYIQMRSIADLTQPLLKLYKIFSSEKRALSIDQTLDFSSKVNESLSRNSWILPYVYQEGEFHLSQFGNIENVIQTIIDEAKLQGKMTVGELSVVRINGSNPEKLKLKASELQSLIDQREVFVLQGLTMSLDEISDYFLAVAPVLLSK